MRVALFCIAACMAQSPRLLEQLGTAARDGDVATLSQALSSPASSAHINVVSPELGAVGAYAPLHHASDRGHSEVVQLLLRRGAQVNLLTAVVGLTPLMLVRPCF